MADLSLRWAHRPYCWFCRAAAHNDFSVDPDQTPPSPVFFFMGHSKRRATPHVHSLC